MSEKTEQALMRIDEPGAVALRQVPSVAEVMHAAIQGNISRENLEVAKELLAIHAKQQYAQAFATLQAKLPVIVAKSVIPNRGKYEKFEDIWDVLAGPCREGGFSISFRQSTADNRLTEVCKVSHIGGHSEEHPFTVRVGGRADSETQADCKASTTARRNALIRAFNIVIRQDCLLDDDDPRNEGDYITPKQAEELAHRLNAVGGDRTKFLELAEAESFEKIMSGKYDMLSAQLLKKERHGK
jgi:hypothetical protein